MASKVRMKDIAAKAGVSIGTVSYVLNHSDVHITQEVRERVLATAKEMNYTVNWAAKSLKIHHNNAIGVIAEDMRSWFISPLIEGICKYCEENDIRVLLCNLRADSKTKMLSHDDISSYRAEIDQQVRSTFGKQVDGLIYIGAIYHDVSDIYMPTEEKIVYLYSFCGDNPNSTSVYYNDYQGAALAVNHLIENGHKKIAYIDALLGTIPGEDRLNAFLNVMKENNNPIPENWIIHCQNINENGVEDAIRSILTSPERPTAIYTSMDSVCPMVYEICDEIGMRIPEDLSIAGFDDDDLCKYLRPKLTSISFPAIEMGYEAARMICTEDLIAGKHLLDCKLVKRATVANLCK